VSVRPLGVAFVNLGCRVNRVELDSMAESLEDLGCVMCDESEASAIVVNTCAVTGEAQTKARKAVRHAALLPQRPLVVATGCVASLFSGDLSRIASNVVVETDKGRVAQVVAEGLRLDGEGATGTLAVPVTPTPTGRTRPGVKIQDGCDNRCTYCIVWKARGPSRSVDPDVVVKEVRAAMARGAHEVVLTGINLGGYRAHADKRELRLHDLLDRILGETDVERLRISSIEPPDVTGDLLRVMAASDGRIAPFLHVCLQSGCDETLRRMGRVYRSDLYRRATDAAREALPEVALGTDLIVGFPGETDDEFARSFAFCAETGFARMHVFRYSRRPGTIAATAAGQVDPHVMAVRSREMRGLARRMRHTEAMRLVGTDQLVVVQYPGRGVSGGLFDVLVDPCVPVDSLIRIHVSAVRDDGTLVGRA